jgi:hypothetical protein
VLEGYKKKPKKKKKNGTRETGNTTTYQRSNP